MSMKLGTPSAKGSHSIGAKKVKSRTFGNKSQTTVVACVNVVGQAIPPYVIYNAKTLNPEWMKDGPPSTKHACSENGWIDTDLFEHWFKNHFLTHAVSSRPLLDGHKTHYQPHVCQEAKKCEVIIFCLPPHSTHVSIQAINPLRNVAIYMRHGNNNTTVCK